MRVVCILFFVNTRKWRGKHCLICCIDLVIYMLHLNADREYPCCKSDDNYRKNKPVKCLV